ncbi:DUF397 domain-containing protein [Streptomyces buecherae]|uniref:DUF397 domain-containing protein n=2 Tax=Streptomyces buecherae TaxID=2763006 RepID=A0A7H8N3V6_9ACTN|nr:DUF397 domain-containing protein [Streptomyces buecherae]QKW49003.1 DUF397 domain-containing protein [Streptomyces buecherae]
MQQVHNGMTPASAIAGVTWVKSQRTAQEGQCVELAALADGRVAMRNSRHQDGPALVYTRDEIAAFLDGAKRGEFDFMIG